MHPQTKIIHAIELIRFLAEQPQNFQQRRSIRRLTDLAKQSVNELQKISFATPQLPTPTFQSWQTKTELKPENSQTEKA